MYAPRRAPVDEERVVRGLRMHLTRWPGSDPRPWLLLHGWADTGGTFQFLADALPDTRTLVAPDWRGFGASDWAVGGYWFPDYFADLEQLIAQLSPEASVTLIGHSMGANVAMMYAGIRPERVRAVVSIDGFGLPPTQPEQAPTRYRAWLDEVAEIPAFARFPSHAAFAEYLHKRSPRLPRERAEFVARAWTEPVPDGGVRMRADPQHKRVNPVLYRREEAQACWREIRAPLLMVAAADSGYAARVAGEATLERMRELVPTSRLVTIPDCGHMVHHEQPAALGAAIEEFLVAVDGT
jgi:pimeloyl-ACP methyl ester carboxylesterase